MSDVGIERERLPEHAVLAIRKVLANLKGARALDRGQKLFEEGAVASLDWKPAEFVLAGRINDGVDESVEILVQPDTRPTSLCSCPSRRMCAHRVALMLGAISRHETSIEPATAGGPPKSAAGFVAAVASRTGVKILNRPAVELGERIWGWWEKKKRMISASDLRTGTDRRFYWDPREVMLYPRDIPPADIWDLLACVEYRAGKIGYSFPEVLKQAVDRDRQRELVESWERRERVREWRSRLELWTAQSVEDEETPEFRLRLRENGALVEWRREGQAFVPMKAGTLREWVQTARGTGSGAGRRLGPGPLALLIQLAQNGYVFGEFLDSARALSALLQRLLFDSDLRAMVATESGEPLPWPPVPLCWKLVEPASPNGAYEVRLMDPAGATPQSPIAIVRSTPAVYVTPPGVFTIERWPFSDHTMAFPMSIPPEALETVPGIQLLEMLGLSPPEKVGARIRRVEPRFTVRCRLHRPEYAASDYLQMRAWAGFRPGRLDERWDGRTWVRERGASHESQPARRQPGGERAPDEIVIRNRGRLRQVSSWLAEFDWRDNFDNWCEWRVAGRDFPERFCAWMSRRPDGLEIELCPELATLRDGRVSGAIRLDVESSGVDWFDLRVVLDISEVTLTAEEIAILLKAGGRWVRLAGKGWRKLEVNFTPEEEAELAELGLAANDLHGEPQRLHALQLAGAGRRGRLLPEERLVEVRRRASEIKTRVAPPVPGSITAALRPYQVAGFHFLAYLSANQFGGILADDMGLGKTVQTLAWLACLRDGTSSAPRPVLVVCPKSVQDNWHSEAARFFPKLRTGLWTRESAGQPIWEDGIDLVVVHYQHLRMHEELLAGQAWSAVVLDEAQAIKNPASQTARAACRLKAGHRLALTGTPIENRLLDLWSIMAFAMPGVLGNRASFARNFDSKADPLARSRLAARLRPFLLRRTKKEVAPELPDRMEEDLFCEMEGTQQRLYQAELKRARAQLLKVETSSQLDKARFNILTSLLRLRQICCHPALVGLKDAGESTSAKIDSFLDVVEPLMEEGHKVLVFSQFVEMLALIEREVQGRKWPYFMLTGQTEDRGDLVREFQNAPGAAIFLLSLKAGGFGLNLTAASYVVLCDPWWNPAVESQAIDRTHRIGQSRNVIAYRLLIKDSIEEKIRTLQKHKAALAEDVLGEQNFTQALTLDDFRFLFGANEGA